MALLRMLPNVGYCTRFTLSRRALEAIFSHYSTAYSDVAGMSGGRTKPLLRFVALAAFCKVSP